MFLPLPHRGALPRPLQTLLLLHPLGILGILGSQGGGHLGRDIDSLLGKGREVDTGRRENLKREGVIGVLEEIKINNKINPWNSEPLTLKTATWKLS